MSKKREGRVNSAIQKLASDFIERELDFVGVLITVTRIEVSRGFKEARIFVSVWPEDNAGKIFSALEKSGKAFYEYMKENFKIKYMPSFEFRIDKGEIARRRLEDILKKGNPA